jgi:hypothetical protein
MISAGKRWRLYVFITGLSHFRDLTCQYPLPSYTFLIRVLNHGQTMISVKGRHHQHDTAREHFSEMAAARVSLCGPFTPDLNTSVTDSLSTALWL